MKTTNIEVKGLPVYKMFSKNDEKQEQYYTIPKYQREYIWSKNEWEAMFDDILDNSQGYFLGSIIAIKYKKESQKIEYEIIDGQQRLTTISILILAIYKKLQELKTNLSDEQLEVISKLKQNIIPKKAKKTRLTLQTQGNNYNDYLLLLNNQQVFISNTESPYAKNRRIFKAFDYFKSRLEKITDNESEFTTELFNFIDKVRRSVLVFITVDNQSDAYTLFESLNNRGKPLTPIDLIKNQFLSKISNENKDINDDFEKWKKVINNLGDEYPAQERFFRQNFNAFRNIYSENSSYDLKKRVATRTTLINIYENLINNNPQKFIDEILENSNIYSEIILNCDNYEYLKNNSDIKNSLLNLQRIGGAPSYILILYLVKFLEKLNVNLECLNKIVNFLISFFVRRNLTDKPATRNLTKLFMDQIAVIEEKKLISDNLFNAIKNNLINSSASESEFKEKLRGQIFADNEGVTRFILCFISELHNLEKSNIEQPPIDFWQRNDKNYNYIWTIEHIFPQGVNIPECWVKMIANGDKEKAKEYQEKYVHTLGNLTLSGYNSSLSNASFIDKRDKKDSKGNYIGYKNGIYLNEKLSELDKWTIDLIQERTDELVNEALDIFKL